MYTGTINLDEIKLVYDKFLLYPPSEKKMKKRRKEYKKNHRLDIVVREGTFELLDGFTYYTLAKELGLSSVKCTYVEKDEIFLSGNVKDEDKIKSEIYKRNNYTCYICGDKVNKYTGHNNINFATIDHFLPKARGGYSNEDNLKCCCRFCNALKANTLYNKNLAIYIRKEKAFAKKNKITTVSKYNEVKRQMENIA